MKTMKYNRLMRILRSPLCIMHYALCIGMMFTSCEDMLETDSSRQVFDPELSEKTDSVFYALGILQGMQQLADQYVFQGEMRGDITRTTRYTDNNLRKLADFSATTANKYDSAYVYYRVINNCNYYIAHRDTSLHTGADFVVMKEYVAVKAIRAWAYMQLARVYGKVPFYTEPLTQISQIDEGNYPELDMEGIVSKLAPDLEQYTGYETPNFGNVSPQNSAIYPSRLFIPVDLVLGDMYLEIKDYHRAATHYVTYLTEVAPDSRRHIAFTQSYLTSRSSAVFDLPSDWHDDNLRQRSNTSDWESVFTPSNDDQNTDIICYIPMAPNSQQGHTSEIPMAFGYDYYSTSASSNYDRYIDEIQILPSESYVNLSNSQDFYYYSTASSYSQAVVNSAKLGDTRYAAITYERDDTEADSTKLWVSKYTTPRVILYRTSTVMMHLAEAFNRLGMYDAAFAILKDGLTSNLSSAPYLSEETLQALRTTYPILSSANVSKFTDAKCMFGVHTHGAGYANDANGTNYWPGLSQYQLEPIVAQKMAEIAAEYNVTVGTSKQDSINAVEDLLCDEYALEFAFEGSRFYDLCRLARHKNANSPYGANFGGLWLARKLAYKNPTKDLTSENNWYLPFK